MTTRERPLEEVINDPSAENPGENVDQTLLRERIGEVLRSLTPREREVIEMRFGLKDGQPRTLDEVARCYGITRERIRQIEARSLLKLRQPLAASTRKASPIRKSKYRRPHAYVTHAPREAIASRGA